MQVGVHANAYDSSTSGLAEALSPIARDLGRELSGDYQGVMEHLWIDLELIESHARPDGKPCHPFRFQKRVSGRSHLGLPPTPDQFNVGHFSVRPDFARLRSMSVTEAVPYILQLLYDSSAVLLEKEKRLGGFDAARFRTSLREICRQLGYGVVA